MNLHILFEFIKQILFFFWLFKILEIKNQIDSK